MHLLKTPEPPAPGGSERVRTSQAEDAGGGARETAAELGGSPRAKLVTKTDIPVRDGPSGTPWPMRGYCCRIGLYTKCNLSDATMNLY